MKAEVWIYIGIILCMRVLQSIFSKRASSSIPENAVGYLKYTAFYQGVAGVLALMLLLKECFSGVVFSGEGQTTIYAIISGAALTVCCMCTVYALSRGTMVLQSLFSTAGLLIPTIVSMLLYDEMLKWYQWLALAVLIFAAWLLIGSSARTYGKFDSKTFLILILGLVTNGITMVMQKMFGMNVEGGSVSLFSFISFASGTLLLVIGLGVLAFVKERTPISGEDGFTCFPKKGETGKLPKDVYLYGFMLAVAVFVINQLATVSTSLISAVLLFAFINGGATFISAIVGAVMFREKFTIRSTMGLLLGVGSLIMLKL